MTVKELIRQLRSLPKSHDIVIAVKPTKVHPGLSGSAFPFLFSLPDDVIHDPGTRNVVIAAYYDTEDFSQELHGNN
jgi:hypothetical protein